MKVFQFPKEFLWGTAISAHQTEGNNTNTDWWEWEHREDKGEFPRDASDVAIDSYNRYPEDFELCAKLGTQALRLSIEWARIEPHDGIFDDYQIKHYISVLKTAREKGQKTFVTLHHFTNPSWFAKKGGWENLSAPFYFARYAAKCAERFSDVTDFFLTINEPQVLTLMGYVKGIWPPNIKNKIKALIVTLNLLRAHSAAYNSIKKFTTKPVGIVKHIAYYTTYNRRGIKEILDKLAAKITYFLNCDGFLFFIANKLDFIGVNYYFTSIYKDLKIDNPREPASDLGWYINFEGLYKVLKSLRKYDKPIYITENGIADYNDSKRVWFIKNMLLAVHKAIADKVDVRGYFYWSLLDNYEWREGFWPRFGLVEIDRNQNLQRNPRPSFKYYSDICKTYKLVVDENETAR